MLAHEEIRALITALGSSFGSTLDLAKLRYHRIIIMTDADVDGAHIRTLLLTFFFRNMHELIERGYLFIAQPPLYRAQNGREHTWLFSDVEKDQYFSNIKDGKKITLQRYKGLGEMNPEQLWETTMDPQRRTMLKVDLDLEKAMAVEETFSHLMGDDVSHRKRFIQQYATQVRNLDI
jgi:DNA gyrase subunit B